MAEDHRVFQNKGSDPPLLPIVDVAAADSGVVYGDEDIVRRLDLWLGSLFECNIVWFVENEGEILDKD